MSDRRQIRVLIVDDIAETRENIIRSLQFDTEIKVIAAAQSGKDGIRQAKELKPDVIIMDINMPDMDGIAATEAIRKALPSSQIVILSVQGDSNYMRKAMLVGARDFLTKPPSIDELTSAVHRAGTLAHELQAREALEAEQRAAGGNGKSTGRGAAGTIVAVYSPKGGVGCTTIATNLAVSLLAGSKRVLLVDGNIQFGDVAIFLNVQARNSLADLTPRAEELDEEVVQSVVTLHQATGLNLLPAPPSPEIAEKVDSEQFGRMLAFLRTMYDFVVVDTNSYLSDVVQSTLTQADIILLLTSQDIPSIKNSSLFLNLADITGIDRSKIIFVMNHFDKRIGISAERVGENLKQEISLTIPYDERLMVSASINKGVPICTVNKNHPVSKGVAALTNKIREKLSKGSESE